MRYTQTIVETVKSQMNVPLDHQDIRSSNLHCSYTWLGSRDDYADRVSGDMIIVQVSFTFPKANKALERLFVLPSDAASQNPRLEKTKNPVGLMLVKRQNNRNNNKPPKCEAYAWNTDFSQRQGAIFHGAFYHALTSESLHPSISSNNCDGEMLANNFPDFVLPSVTGFLAMLVHQGLRGIAPNTLPALYKFVPSLQGQWGLWATGAIMVYAGLQTMSYS